MNADLAKCMKVWIVPDIEISRQKILDWAKCAQAVRFGLSSCSGESRPLYWSSRGKCPPFIDFTSQAEPLLAKAGADADEG
ncbi:hypothetical protein [Mesorhizobium sp.]|uniref:hypothetical protein n=1 Tax=Mesorhizobium sp. TaxID=1871066 RepID=UPI000FE9A21F|nr:hypothetical protein [Mesorhizobium sp.]RWD83582.1 MAG: hypothetical protein EOS48_07625 [Mesorhizobium sp.]